MNSNHVFLCGRLGKDPEMRYTQNGTAVCNFSIAISDYRKKKEGDGYDEETTWVDITTWSRLAERVAAQAKKGTQVIVDDGSIKTRSWDDQDGTKHFRTYVLARNIQFGEGRIRVEEGESVDKDSPGSDNLPVKKTPSTTKSAPKEDEDSDLPF